MSTLNVNTITPNSGTTITIGGSGDTITLPSGATLAVESGATISNSGTASGFGGTNTPAFTAYSNTDQTVTSGVWTKANLQAEIIDTDSAFDSTTNYRFTVPAGEGGNYTFWGSISGYDSNETISAVGVKIYKNGSEVSGAFTYFDQRQSSTPGNYMLAAVSIVVSLVATDYIELYGYVTGGGTRKFQNSGTILSGYKLVS